jgi:membrane protein YqaA with SNARE-associated domain
MDLFTWGYLGLFGGSFASATLIPFPSEGLLVGYFELSYSVWICVVVATIGNTLGGMTNYYLGRLGSSEMLIKRFKLNQDMLFRHEQKFKSWGPLVGLLAWLPIVGDPLLVALGFYKVPPAKLAIFVLLGKFGRYAVIAVIYLSWIT